MTDIKYHQVFFNVALYTSYILYIIAFFQIDYYNPRYLDMLENVMKYYVIGFLLIRFNPFIKSSFTEFDRKVVFSSAIFLLATTTISQYGRSIATANIINKF
jgi:hypothetical protein|tara:strand:+ start:1733 stop:2038 length:306 start_codon:yes stop_codon:yes gene_type:complete